MKIGVAGESENKSNLSFKNRLLIFLSSGSNYVFIRLLGTCNLLMDPSL